MKGIVSYERYKEQHPNRPIYTEWTDEFYYDIDDIIQEIIDAVEVHDYPTEDAMTLIDSIRKSEIKFCVTVRVPITLDVGDVMDLLESKEILLTNQGSMEEWYTPSKHAREGIYSLVYGFNKMYADVYFEPYNEVRIEFSYEELKEMEDTIRKYFEDINTEVI